MYILGEQRNAAAYAKCADVIACLSGGSGLSMAALESLAAKKTGYRLGFFCLQTDDQAYGEWFSG